MGESASKAAKKAVYKAGKVATREVRKATRSSKPRAAHLGPAKRRPMILDAAFEVFLERGFEGASMEAIAKRAGVSKPVVYNSFESKTALFGELMAREEQRMLESIAKALPTELHGLDVKASIQSALQAFLEAVQGAPAAFQVIFLGIGGSDAAITKRVNRGRQSQIEIVSQLVQNWMNENAIPESEVWSRFYGYVLVGVAESTARALLAEPERWTAADLAARATEQVAGGYESMMARAAVTKSLNF